MRVPRLVMGWSDNPEERAVLLQDLLLDVAEYAVPNATWSARFEDGELVLEAGPHTFRLTTVDPDRPGEVVSDVTGPDSTFYKAVEAALERHPLLAAVHGLDGKGLGS